MEFLDEESRPRFLFQSRAGHTVQSDEQSIGLRKPSLLASLPLSILFFVLSLFSTQSEPLRSLLLWSALSLLLGPFAPSSLTAGDIRVGVGKLLEPLPQNDAVDKEDFSKRTPNRRLKPRKNEELGHIPSPVSVHEPEKVVNRQNSSQSKANSASESVVTREEREWTDGDMELLKKLLAKHPVGKPKRWEAISEAFERRHGVESVIKMAKSMGEKKTSDADSFARFLKDRKPLDERVDDAERESKENGDGGVNWSAGDDIALLNALKAFPKDTAMRWEKIAAAVPGKTKAACMKRVSELKKDFRSSKAASNEA